MSKPKRQKQTEMTPPPSPGEAVNSPPTTPPAPAKFGRGRPKKSDPPRPPKPPRREKAGRPKLATGPAPHRLSIRTTDEYHAWITGLAIRDRIATIPDLIDRALAAYARMIGYEAPQPARRYKPPE
jgi:hypothetical protein